MWMHCVQYVALSRADLQRWQKVRPHLMQEPAKPPRRRFRKSIGARRIVSAPAAVTGLRALISGSNQAQLPNSVRATPLRATLEVTLHACGSGGVYITTFCAGGFDEIRSMELRSMRLAWSSFCACSSNLYVSPLAM